MGADGHAPADVLTQWRAHGHDRLDPVQFAFLEAMQRRAEGRHGALREVLDARIAVLMQAYAAQVAAAEVAAAQSPVEPRPAWLNTASRGTYPELAALPQFRALWATLRNESQVRQTLAQAPSDGGPLNSSVLVHRTLNWMGDVSPGYLQHFLAYLDNLAWLDTLQQRGTLPSRESASPGAKPRRPRTAR
jgi:hypothetical protein